MYGYIYETTNLVNGKKYIGKKVSNIFVKSYYGSGILLKKALSKYGKENFSVVLLDEADNNEDLNNKEKYYINKFNATKSDLYYNIAEGGDGGNTYKNLSYDRLEDIKSRISSKLKGIPHSSTHTLNASRARIGIKENYKYRFTDEHKRKLSESNKGKHCKAPNKGKKAVHYGKTIKYVNELDLDSYIKQGWSLGTFREKDSKGRFI